jgi:histidinol phosphatase-like PHP family hydrolase
MSGPRPPASNARLVSFPSTFGIGGAVEDDWRELFETLACVGTGVVAEATEQALLSLEPVLRAANEAGASVLLASGAASVALLDRLELAVGQARRAWIEEERVLNCLGVFQLRALWRHQDQPVLA